MFIIAQGIRDGFDQPDEFNVGMSYESRVRQFIYDWATILGQHVARAINRRTN